ncbi:MAG: hypothetical protein EOO53_15925 [Gammaproteobacteria bacterium]|nr:MAG: hypothetical protein EOO53_15925 [Gammaproteobacteria bacterium]
MQTVFWIKRALIAALISFTGIFIGQYLKSGDVKYAFTQASVWGVFTTTIYLLVLWRKVKKNPACAIKQQEKKQ